MLKPMSIIHKTQATTVNRQVLSATNVFALWQHQLDSAPQILVALSGGLDSTLLLHLLTEVVPLERIRAIHINHGLSPDADAWQVHAETYCRSLGVSFYAETIEVSANGEGLEAAARSARYGVFKRVLEKDALLLLGHHGDDQAETLLYRLMRGSGSKGLASMPAQRSLGLGQLIRPLLPWSKATLQQAAIQRQLHWIEDDSNADNRFDRNYLRNQVIPAIADRWPDYTRSLGQSAAYATEAEQLAEILAKEDLAQLKLRVERAGWSIAIELLLSKSDLRQRNILRYWPAACGLPMPNRQIIDEITGSILSARDDGSPQVVWQSMQWRRFRGRLYLLKSQSAQFDQAQRWQWSLDHRLELADGSCLEVQEETGEGLILAPNDCLTVRYRRGGERCRPAGRSHSNSLKKLLQEFALEPWWRDRMPLLYVGETLVAVGDCWICDGWQAGPQQQGKKIRWQVNSL